MADCKNNAEYTSDTEKYMSNCNHSSEDWVFSVGGSTVTKKVVTDDIYFEGITDVTINQGADFDPTAGVSAHDGDGNELPFEVVPSELTDPCEIGEHDFEYKAFAESHPLLASWCNSDKQPIYMPPCNLIVKIAHRIVTIVQSALPTISGLVKATLNVGQSFDPLNGVTAEDANGNAIEDITYSGVYDDDAEGKIASFETDYAQNAKAVEVTFNPIQEGTPWIDSTENTAPYLIREVDTDGNSEYDTLVGGSVAWNQLASLDVSKWTSTNVTATESGGVIRVSPNVDTTNVKTLRKSNMPINHVYYYKGAIRSDGTNEFRMGFYGQNSHTALDHQTTTSNDYTSVSRVYKPTEDCYFGLRFPNAAPSTAYGDAKEPQLIDLTLAFGSTIADYAYTLEQATAGSGIAWLKSYGFLGKDYFPFDSGSMLSVHTTAKKITGKNLFDKEAIASEKGYLDVDGNFVSSNPWRVSDYIRIDGNITVSGISNAGNAPKSCWYDGNKTFISSESLAVPYKTLTPPSGAKYIRLSIYNADIDSIQLELGSTATPYEPYISQSYPLADTDLRGVLKLDASNNLYYDGDVYEASGNVTRNRFKLTLTGNETYTSTASYVKSDACDAYIIISNLESNAWWTNTIGNRLVAVARTIAPWAVVGYPNTFTVNSQQLHLNIANSLLGITDYTQETGASVATKVKAYVKSMYDNGTPLEFDLPLATPTTESLTPYTSPQTVYDGGTEEYVDARTVPMPVGHKSRYAGVYPISGWTQIETTVVDDDDSPTVSHTYTTDLDRTVYGGYVDLVSGVLTVTHRVVDTFNNLYWSNTSRWSIPINDASSTQRAETVSSHYQRYIGGWSNQPSGTFQAYGGVIGINDSNIPAESTTIAQAIEYLTNMHVQFMIPLATPQTYQLDRHQIGLLLGENNVWSDTNGTTRVVFTRALPQSGEVQYPLAGTYEITYEAEDQCGNVGTATREVEVTAS